MNQLSIDRPIIGVMVQFYHHKTSTKTFLIIASARRASTALSCVKSEDAKILFKIRIRSRFELSNKLIFEFKIGMTARMADAGESSPSLDVKCWPSK